MATVYIGRTDSIAVNAQGPLPPGQHETNRWPRLDLGVVPHADLARWDLTVDGAVESPRKLSYDEVLRLPPTRVVADFHCVTGWSKLTNEWRGVSIRAIADIVNPIPTARYVTFACDEGYTTSHPLDVLYDNDVLLAYNHDGQPLPAEHGGPLRLVVPKRYAYKSAKWVRRLKFTEKEELGYWEVRGYSNSADPWTEDRYSY